MLRSLIVGAVTVTVASLVLIGLATQHDPPVPHVRLPDRGSHLQAQPGSSLEGIAAPVRTIQYAAAVHTAKLRLAEEQRLAAEAQVVAEVTYSAPAQSEWVASAPSEPSPDGWTEWDWQARCETGGDWSMQGSSYSGGLGFLNGSWDAYGGQEFASNAGLATREQQIIIAERIQDVPPVNDASDACTGW